jgi:thiamine kinase-like enzyme
MAKWFKKLHTTTKKTTGYYLISNIKPYYKNYLKYRNNIKDKSLKQKLEIYINQSLELLKINNKVFTNRKYSSLLHNDTSSENVFYKKGYVKLIDWEFVGYGLLERELVYFLDSYNLTEKQIKLFLKTYGYKGYMKQLNLIYLVLLFSSIGYSLWRIDINKNNEKEKTEAIKRLIRDTNLLENKIIELK